MAFNMQEFNVLRLLLLVLSTLPLIKTTNIDCNGKAFHCVNSTHFMICVDIGRGLSSTVDDFVIPCPMNTECRITNRFECDYPPTPTTTTLPTTSVLVKDFTRTVNHMETTSRVANNVKYPNTVSLITETNGIDKSAATEPIDSTTGFDFADLKNLMEQSLSPLLNEAYTENYLQLSTLTSGRDEVTTDIPATTTMSTDKMITGTVTKIVGIAKIIGDSPTYSSQYDTTPISAVSAPSLKDFASKYNVYEDVLMGHSPNENIELLADVDFELHNLEIAPNSELYVPSEVLANEIYKNVDDTNAEMISSIANDMGNTLHTSKMDTVNSNINDTVTTKSSLSSKNGFLTHNTKASTDISITPGDISHTPPKYVVPTDSKLLDTSTFLISDFSIEFTTEPATIQDSTMMLTSNALPAETLTEIDNIPFLEENVFYSTVPTQIKEITAKEPKPVNDLLPENYAIRDTSIYGTKISEKPSTIVEDYTYPTNGDSNDLTTEMAVSFFSFHKYVDKALEKTTTDIGTINFGKQDITETSSINVVPTDSIVIDSSTALINDFVSEFTTELLNIQDSTVDLMSYALSAVTEIKNVPFKSNNMFYGTEVTQTDEKITDVTQVNVLLIEEHTLPVSNTLKRTISELPVTVVDEIHMEPKNSNDNDFTSAHTETTFTTAPYSKVFDGVSSKNTDAETAEDIGTKVFTDNNIPSKYYTPDQPLKPTEATSTSYLFEYNDQDLEVTEHAVTTISTDLKHSLEPSNKMLSTSSHAKKTYVDLAKSKNYAPDNDLLSTVANEVVESATEFYVQVKSNQSFYKTNLSRNVENFTVPVQVVQHKTGRHGEEITKKDTDHSSVIQVNTESITKTTTNINTDSQKISTYDAELIFLSKVDKTAEKETDKPFISRVDYTPKKYDTTTTFTSDSNVGFATSTPITSQVNIQEILTEPERHTMVPKINKIPNKLFILSNTDQMQRQDVTESFRPTLVTRDINKEISKNIDVRFAANDSISEGDSKSYNKNNVNSNVLHLATKELIKSQTTVNITENKYQTYLGTVSKENNESITTFNNIRHNIDWTTSKDLDVTVSDSLDYGMEIKDRLNLEKHVITSSTKYVHTRNKYREQDVVLELGNALSSTNSKDIQTDQLTNITEHITVTESYKEHNGNLGYKNIKTYEETPTILPIQLQSTNNVDVNITVTDKSNNKDSVTFDILEYKNKSYAGYENITESNNKKDIIFTIENKISLNASANYSESTRQNEAAAYIGNKIKGTYNTRELSVELTKLVANISSIDAPATISNQNLSLADNSTLQTNIKTQKDSKKSGFQPIAKVQIEVTNAKDITDITNVDFNSEKNTTQTSTKEITKLNKYVILGKNENKEVVENMNYDNIGSNNTYNHMTNTIANSTIPEMVLRTTSDKPVQTNVIKIMTESYHASKIHNSVPSLQNTTAQINASKNISQKDNAIFWNNKAEKLSLNNLLSSHTIKPVNEDQSAHDPKKVENGKPTTLKSFGIDLNRTVNFDCLYRFRGKYADNTNCRKFYICIGKPYPIIGMCPVDTVFSEYRKQCTKSLAHCVRNHVFYCTSEGRFTDIFTNNMYYICVRTIENKFIRYKLQCDDGYHLNKALVQCTPNAVVKSLSKLLDSDKSQRSSSSLTNSSESLKSKSDDSICQKEGKIPNPNDCRKYFVCSKKKLYFKKKVKSCDSDEVFDKQKEKCVDAESYEC